MKFYDSMGFESEHGIWVRRVDAAELEAQVEHSQHVRANLHAIKTLEAALYQAQNAAVQLSSKLGTAETRIAELEAALRKVTELGGHEHMDCADIATQALGSPSRDKNLSTGSALSDPGDPSAPDAGAPP